MRVKKEKASNSPGGFVFGFPKAAGLWRGFPVFSDKHMPYKGNEQETVCVHALSEKKAVPFQNVHFCTFWVLICPSMDCLGTKVHLLKTHCSSDSFCTFLPLSCVPA